MYDKNCALFLYQISVGEYFGWEGVLCNNLVFILRASNTSLILLLDGYTK